MKSASKKAHYHHYMDYAATSLQVAKGWRESASYARKHGDSKAAKLFAKAARESARQARLYVAKAHGRKSIHSRPRRSR